jgi:hypothetical protein
LEAFYNKGALVSTYIHSLGDECKAGNYQTEKIRDIDQGFGK